MMITQIALTIGKKTTTTAQILLTQAANLRYVLKHPATRASLTAHNVGIPTC